MRKGDLITVAGFKCTRRKDLPSLEFVAERLVIADTESATDEIYQSRGAVPRLVMQTSARVTGERLWILDAPRWSRTSSTGCIATGTTPRSTSCCWCSPSSRT